MTQGAAPGKRSRRVHGEITVTSFNPFRTVSVTAAFAVLLAASIAAAQNFPDKDTREINSYVLTEAALAKYAQATGNLNALAKSSSAACDDDDGTTASLDASVARINSTPGAQAAIQSAGMTTREYVVFTWSMVQTGLGAWALSQPGGTLPPGVSKANVDFFRAHEQAFNQLSTEDSDPCDGEDESDEDAKEQSE
jgi:hypothetical protein